MKYQIIPAHQQRLILKLLRKNLLFLILLPATGAFIGFYKAYRIPNVYKAQSQFLYKGDQSDMLGGQYGGSRYGLRNGFDGENQKRILKSYDLMGEVVDKFDWEVSYKIVGRLRKTVLYPTPTNFQIEVDSIAPELVGRPITLVFGPQEILLKYFKGGVEVIEKFEQQSVLSCGDITLRIKGSREEIARNKIEGEYEIIVNSRNALINKFRGALRVDVSERSSVLAVSISDQNVFRAIDVLDSLALVYGNFSTREKRLKNKRSLDFIEAQIANVTASINQSEFEVEGVKESNSIINLSAEQSRYNEKLITYEDQILQVDLELQRLNQLEEYLEQATEDNFMPPSVYIPQGDAFLQGKLTELYEILREREEGLYGATSENPVLIRNRQVFSKIKTELLDYIEKSKTALESRKSQIRRMVRKYEGNLKALPQSQREILNIERRIAVNEKLYNYLLEQRATKIIEGASIAPEFEILDSARSYGIIGPNRGKMIQTYGLYGFALVVAIGAIRFFFFDKMESLKELKDNTKQNVVAGIPRFKEMIPLNDPDYMNSDQAYAIRKLRTSIQFLAANQGKEKQTKIILVSSLFPSEGKTFVSSSLANLNSLSGKRVVVVDFDLHKPNLHKQFGLDKNIAGLSMILTGHSSIQEATQEISPNLHVITSGPLPPNPSELVIRDETLSLIESLRQQYDVVILDTPPVTPVTDAKTLMKLSDINLLVMNGKFASRVNLNTIDELLDEVGNEKSGIVFNAIKTPVLMALYGKYAYKYGYTYGYNYGYAYEYAYRYGKSRT